MKILWDIVYTQQPDKCSTAYTFFEIIGQMIKDLPSVYHYVVYTEKNQTETGKAFLSQYPSHVTLLPSDQLYSDRLTELHRIPEALIQYLRPYGPKAWDADIVITSRVPMIKHMVPQAVRSGSEFLKLFIGIDEMPCLPFRHTVPFYNTLYPDTLISYALADAIIMPNLWTKRPLREAARRVLSPARTEDMLRRVHEAVPVRLEELNLKADLYESGMFTLLYAGRFSATSSFGKVAEVFRDKFSYPLGKNRQAMNFVVSTHSQPAIKESFGEVDFLDIQKNDRAKFHDLLKTVQVAYVPSTAEDFSLTVYEMLRAGVPLIIHDYPWNAFLGPKYPFRVSNQIMVHALINEFARDYVGMYKKFAEWAQTDWHELVHSNRNVTPYEVICGLIVEWDSLRIARAKDLGPTIHQRVKDYAKDQSVVDVTKFLYDEGALFDEKVGRVISRVPATIMFKLKFEELGYVDTAQTGIMVKKELMK